MKNMSESLENYLRAIYILHIDGKIPRIKDISKMLDVRDASTVEAIKRLEKSGMITHEKYGYINLNEKGLAYAERVYRKYITLIDFFVNILNLSKEESYKLSCGIEHHMTKDFFTSLEAMMLFIKRNPIEYTKMKQFIKKYSNEMPHVFRTTLEEVEEGEEIKIISLSGSEDKKQQLLKLGIYPGLSLILNKIKDNYIELYLKGKNILIEKENAKFIIVE
ncbi:metal-dependent transcriptional regulator [Geotoga petraea]|jgi:DtxR family Mn-dependent transcriptional regulator|uniref:Iron (Metal) dependent repressor, DtxR family n=1 Tax=Geotoga petraea TaxID=28234 RepID=A0A1G6LIU7_9BACT|nr:metal-dependent transcriptional regulator [Geotoga petraea]MDK2946792.1 DtxR family transcriptional regulator, Mn-dependent transcriptional regulator [Geotoga sp.]SDC43129.1 iron (metal) dependent repressor, DtxR family [Geotoga petraea]